MVVRKMKEKCKDAARMRREKERAEFVELSKLLPLPSSTTSQLDKASVIRLTSSYLRMRSAFPRGLGESWGEQRRPERGARVFGQVCQALQSDNISACASTDELSRTQPQPQPQPQPQFQPQQQLHEQQQQIRELGSLILQTLDGFVFALHRDGKIMYISETASVHLGLPQIDLSGSSVFEYTHQLDHAELGDILTLSDADKHYLEHKFKQRAELDPRLLASSECHLELGRSFCMRMKCILPKRNAGLVSNGFKAIHCNGYLKVRRFARPPSSNNCNPVAATAPGRQRSSNTNCLAPGPNTLPLCGSTKALDEQQQHTHHWESYALVAVGHSLLPSASTEVKLNQSSFMFRANLDLRLYYVESPMTKLLGYQQSDLIGLSLYQLAHPGDVRQLEEAHRALLRKGQVVSKYFRLMRRSGDHLWLQMQATLVNNPRSMPKPQHVVSICNIISDEPAVASGDFADGSLRAACLVEQNNNNSILAGKLNDSHFPIKSEFGDGTEAATVATMLVGDGRHKRRPRARQSCMAQQQIRELEDATKQQLVGLSERRINRRRLGSLKRNKSCSSTSNNNNIRKLVHHIKKECTQDNVTLSFDSQLHTKNQHQQRKRQASGSLSSTSSPTSFSSSQFCAVSRSDTTNSRGLPTSRSHATANYQHHTIGSTRRASDDSCSVVSSVISTHSATFGSVVNPPCDSQLPAMQAAQPNNETLYYTHQNQQQHSPLGDSSNSLDQTNATILQFRVAQSNYDQSDCTAQTNNITDGLHSTYNYYHQTDIWPAAHVAGAQACRHDLSATANYQQDHHPPNEQCDHQYHEPLQVHHHQYYQAIDEQPSIEYQPRVDDFTTENEQMDTYELDSNSHLRHQFYQQHQNAHHHHHLHFDGQTSAQYYQQPICTTDIVSL